MKFELPKQDGNSTHTNRCAVMASQNHWKLTDQPLQTRVPSSYVASPQEKGHSGEGECREGGREGRREEEGKRGRREGREEGRRQLEGGHHYTTTTNLWRTSLHNYN